MFIKDYKNLEKLKKVQSIVSFSIFSKKYPLTTLKDKILTQNFHFSSKEYKAKAVKTSVT